MKNFFGCLFFLFIITAIPAYSAYEDFTSYQDVNGFTYSKLIDNCNADPGFLLDTYTYPDSGRTTSVSTAVVTLATAGYMSYATDITKEGGRAFIWDKTGTATDTQTITSSAAAESHYRTTNLGIANYDDWKSNSNITFWYYIPTNPTNVTTVEMIVSTDTAVAITTNYVWATHTTGATGVSAGWNYFKRPFSVGVYPDGNTSVLTTTGTTRCTGTGTYTVTLTNITRAYYPTSTTPTTVTISSTTSITSLSTSPVTITTLFSSCFPDYTQFKQYKLGIKTDSVTSTIIGIRVDDIRFVHTSGWTGGIWDERGGIWKMEKESVSTSVTNYVYSQLGDCTLNNMPAVLSKYEPGLNKSIAVALNDYADFTYSAKLKFMELSTPYGGIAFRFNGSKYYLLNLDNLNQQIQLSKYTGGSSISVLSSVAATVSTNTYYYLKTICKGSNIKAYFSADGITWGNPLIDYTDPTSPITSGKVGLFAGGSGTKKVCFDEVKVLPSPNALSAVAKENIVDLTWSIAAARSGEVTNYNIYRRDSGGGAYSKIGTSPTASYTDATAKGETTYTSPTNYTEKQYFYRVSANIADSLGESEFSDEVTTTPYTSLIVKMTTFTPTTNSPIYSKASFIIYNITNEAIELKIYDISGSLVKTVTTPESWNGKSTTVSWDGKDETGNLTESGIYIYQVKLGSDRKGTGTVCLAR